MSLHHKYIPPLNPANGQGGACVYKANQNRILHKYSQNHTIYSCVTGPTIHDCCFSPLCPRVGVQFLSSCLSFNYSTDIYETSLLCQACSRPEYSVVSQNRPSLSSRNLHPGARWGRISHYCVSHGAEGCWDGERLGKLYFIRWLRKASLISDV